MSTRARVEWDHVARGVRLGVARDQGVLVWEQPSFQPSDGPAEVPGAWLHLNEDDARAIYEALADYFGHAGHDTRALRKDYDDERKRVDRLIEAVTRR